MIEQNRYCQWMCQPQPVKCRIDVGKQFCPLGAIAVFGTGSDALHMPPKRLGTAHQANGDPIANMNGPLLGFLETPLVTHLLPFAPTHHPLTSPPNAPSS